MPRRGNRLPRADRHGGAVDGQQPITSPTEVSLDTSGREDLEPVGEAGFIWSPNPAFPAYLRRVREAANVSMRKAAEALGTSYAWLARTETGGSASPPSLDRLYTMAELYRVDAREMLHEAGVRIALPEGIDTGASLDARFRALLLHPDLRPPLFEEAAVPYVSDRLKQQWITFAEKLATHPNPARLVATALAKAGSPE